ncbi:hypothetical protein K3495_g6353 [Podosphaera aphanis]|nr:hypothetical protein K3495_g6353 [Podosphaera aphanis]
MSSNDYSDGFEPTSLVIPHPGKTVDALSELSYVTTNDIMYTILHDLMLESHREAKIERAASAAAIVKQKALQEHPGIVYDTPASVNTSRPETRAAGAVYKDGVIYLVENPLKATSEIICPKCSLPRLLHPTTGRGARQPDPGVEYCKRKPFIDKDYYDVHGQTFVPKGPGRGRRKEDWVDPVLQQLKMSKEGSPPPTQLKEPHAKCMNCGGHQAASRMNNHMSKCIGGLSRESARNAKSKIFGNNETGSQHSHTPPGSRNSTPVFRAGSMKSSPGKRSAEDDPDESDETPRKKKKKKLLKKTQLSKMKTPITKKNGTQGIASNLSHENKITDNEYDEGYGDDTRDSDYGTKAARNKLIKSSSKVEVVKMKPKILRKLLKPRKTPTPEISGKETKRVMESKNRNIRNMKEATPPTEESSQTMSSPNPE